MKAILSNGKGFTLIEAIIVIILFAVIVLIWGFYGRDHVKIAMMNEARMFIEKIVAQERIYFSNKGTFIKTPGDGAVSKMDEIFIDTRSNKYYKTFKIIIGTETVGSDKTATLKIFVYPDTTVVGDLENYYVEGFYKNINNKIEYIENYG
jgi:prepilin-type N-terminal cleavage/methylation domain-containing protein